MVTRQQYSESLIIYKIILHYDMAAAQQQQSLAEHSLLSARRCMRCKNYGRAFAHFLLVLKLQPDVKPQIKEEFALSLKEWTNELESKNRFDDMFTCYDQTIELYPECDTALNNMGIQLYRLGYLDHAANCFRRALKIDPHFLNAQENLENICSHFLERWHFRMLNDVKRNTAFKIAISEAVRRGYHSVLDIGAGTGLLSLFAVEAGAKTVSACEASKPIYDIACRVLDENGLREKINLVQKMSTELVLGRDIPERVSLVVSETVDSGLLGEHILSTLHHAWSHLLIEDANSRVIPAAATVQACVIESMDVRNENRLLYSGLRGMDLSGIHITCHTSVVADEPYTTVNLNTLPHGHKQLTDAFTVAQLDFNDPVEIQKCLQGISKQFLIKVTETGKIDAILMWFDLHVDDRVTISSSSSSDTCWEQAVYPIFPSRLFGEGEKRNMNVKPGDILKISYTCADDCIKLECQEIIKDKIAESVCHNHLLHKETHKLPGNLEMCSIGNVESATHQLQVIQANINLDTVAKQSEVSLHSAKNVNGIDLVNASCEKVYEISLNKNNEQDSNVSSSSMLNYSGSSAAAASCQIVMLGRHDIRKLNDIHTNKKICCALEKVIKPNSKVLYLSLEFPLLGIQAIKTGAEQIFVTTQSTEYQNIATSVAKKNFLNQDSLIYVEDIHNCSKVDVMLVDVVEPSGVLRQQILEDIALARVTCLKDNGRVIPALLSVYGVGIQSEELLKANRVLNDKRTLGWKISQVINDFQTRNHLDIVLSTLSHTRLTEPFKMFDFNFNESINDERLPAFLEQSQLHKITALEEGKLCAIVYWFDIGVDNETMVCTLDKQTYWNQAAMMLQSEVDVCRGQVLKIQTVCNNSSFHIYVEK